MKFIVTLFISFALLAPVFAQSEKDVASLGVSNAPYRVGEHLSYNVSFSNFLTAGHVDLFVVSRATFFNREGLQLRAHIETTGVVNAALYALNNDYTSYINPDSGIPFRTQESVREGGRTADTSREYNEPVGANAIPSKLRTGEFAGTFDPVSALFRLRALPLEKGTVYHFQVRTETEDYQAELKVTGREFVKTSVGSFQTIVTQLRFNNNSTANNYNIRVYFSDDERHVPVLLTARHPAGEIRAELASAELPKAPPPSINNNAASTPPVATPTPNINLPNAALPNGLPFKVGEQLNFNVFLPSIKEPAGTASFLVRERAKYFNRDGLLLTVKAQTSGVAQRLFIANDQISSYVDPNTLLPFRTELVLQEGRRRTNQVFTVEQDRGNALTNTGKRIDIPVGTHDLVSVLYALRSFNIAPPKRNAVSILINNRPRTLFITSLRRESIEVGGQRISAVQLSLTTDDPQSDKFQIRLWVSNDARHLPLRVTAQTALGLVRADLAIIPLTRQ